MPVIEWVHCAENIVFKGCFEDNIFWKTAHDIKAARGQVEISSSVLL